MLKSCSVSWFAGGTPWRKASGSQKKPRVFHSLIRDCDPPNSGAVSSFPSQLIHPLPPVPESKKAPILLILYLLSPLKHSTNI